MRLSWLPLLGLLHPTPKAQDQALQGFERTQLSYPGGTTFAASTALDDGRLIVFDGLSIGLYDEATGILLNDLGSFPSFVFPSFVVADPRHDFAYVGESTGHTIQRVLLSGSGAPELVTVLVNAYDAAFRDDSTLYVSAASCGFGCGNEIWRLELPGAQATLLASVSGASGPLAFGPDGSLYYGTVTADFPPPPDASRILRFGPAQLDGPGGLGEADAALVADGFAGASQLAVDPRTGALFLALNNFATGENRIQWVQGSAVTSPVLLEGRPFLSLGNLDFLPGVSSARFLPHQPASGGALRYTTTDFGTLLERHQVTPRRPQLAFSGPGTQGPGAFQLSLDSGPAHGFARIHYGPIGLAPATEAVLVRGGVPLFLGLDLPSAKPYPGLWSLDAQGALALDLLNPGGLEGTFAVQLLLLDEDLHLAGTSSATAF